jgi:AcrR family transcriptional regulator
MEGLPPLWEGRIVDQTFTASEDRRREHFLEVTRGIVDVGISLVAERGDGSFKVQELVARAGISLHSFYRYFPSKDDLSLAIFEESMRVGTELAAQMAASQPSPLERLRVTVVGPITPGWSHPRNLSAQYIVSEDLRLKRSHPREVEAALLPYTRLIASAIAAAQEAGEFPGIDPMEDAGMIHHLMMTRYHLLAEGLLDGQSGRPDEALWEFCLGALRRKAT